MEVLFSWALPGEVGLATSPHLSGSGEGQAGILGEFQLLVGLTGDGAAEHAGNLVRFLGLVLHRRTDAVFLLRSFPRCG